MGGGHTAQRVNAGGTEEKAGSLTLFFLAPLTGPAALRCDRVRHDRAGRLAAGGRRERGDSEGAGRERERGGKRRAGRYRCVPPAPRAARVTSLAAFRHACCARGPCPPPCFPTLLLSHLFLSLPPPFHNHSPSKSCACATKPRAAPTARSSPMKAASLKATPRPAPTSCARLRLAVGLRLPPLVPPSPSSTFRPSASSATAPLASCSRPPAWRPAKRWRSKKCCKTGALRIANWL